MTRRGFTLLEVVLSLSLVVFFLSILFPFYRNCMAQRRHSLTAVQEAHLAGQAGFHLVRLGPRILRAETAGLAATAAIMDRLGEWD